MNLKKTTDGGHMGMVKIGSPEDMANAIYQMVHHAVELVHGRDGMNRCEMAGSAGLGALLGLSLILCKKPEVANDEELKAHASAIYRSIGTEILVFAGLLVANQYDGMKDHDKDHMALRAKFGTDIFGLALAQWQKIYPELNIEDYLEPPVVEFAKKALAEMESNNFNVEKDFDHRFLLRNNGSIN